MTRREAKPITLLYAAYLKDFLNFTNFEVGRKLALHVDERNRRSKDAQRYVADGRVLASHHGVAPWALWDDGKVPKNWWLEPRFHDGIAAAATRIRPSIFEGGHEPDEYADQLCPPVPVTKGDRDIAMYVSFRDALDDGDGWREGFDHAALFYRALKFSQAGTLSMAEEDRWLERRPSPHPVSEALRTELPPAGRAIAFSSRCPNMRYVMKSTRSFVIPAAEAGVERLVQQEGHVLEFVNGLYVTEDRAEISYLTGHADYGWKLWALDADLLKPPTLPDFETPSSREPKRVRSGRSRDSPGQRGFRLA